MFPLSNWSTMACSRRDASMPETYRANSEPVIAPFSLGGILLVKKAGESVNSALATAQGIKQRQKTTIKIKFTAGVFINTWNKQDGILAINAKYCFTLLLEYHIRNCFFKRFLASELTHKECYRKE